MSVKHISFVIFAVSFLWFFYSFFYYGLFLNNATAAIVLAFLGVVGMYFTFEAAFIGPKDVVVVNPEHKTEKEGQSPDHAQKEMEDYIKILKIRYAKGEITKKQFETMKNALR